MVLQTIKSGWLKIPPLNTVKFSFVSFHSPLLFCTTTFHLNTLISCWETHPGKCVSLCCSDETLCHPFKLFLPTNNPAGQPLRSLSYLSINFISLPPIRLEKKKVKIAWGELSQLISSNHIFFLFSPILSSSPSEDGSYGFQGESAILHLILNLSL